MDGHTIERIVTFGSPKLTDGAGAESLSDLPLMRVTHEDDMIALLPSAPLKDRKRGQWAHCGDLVLLVENKRVKKGLVQNEEGRYCYLTGEDIRT